MIFVARTAEGGEIRYRDTKRWLWIASVAAPSLPLVAVLALHATGNTLWALLPIVFYFGIVPLLDTIVGEDHDNPPEEIVHALSEDPYYRWLLFASVPVYLLSFAAWAVAIGSFGLPGWAVAALTFGTGVAMGAGLTVAHELGHKQPAADRWAAKVVAALTGYGHFMIEHNRGHHTEVATPEDAASARLGESVYRFALREVPGALRRGWHWERRRLAAKGLPFWHWRNDILQSYAVTVLLYGLVIANYGWRMAPLLLLLAFVGWNQLTYANYVEHYGLLRRKLPNGRYEPCQPRHSWNTNHIVSNLLLFHLQRHSDHHANPARPYQALRNFAELPSLPSGYPGSYWLAAIPPLWFRIMDPKVLAWASGDLSATNLCPRAAARYEERYRPEAE